MSWQDSFVPDTAPPPTSSNGWQSSFVPDGAQSAPAFQGSKSYDPLPGEEMFRQVGLAGRDLAGAVPMAIAGLGDLANTGINYATGSHLGMPTDTVQKALSSTGVFPEYGNSVEKGVGTTASILLGGGEQGVNAVREMGKNFADSSIGKSLGNALEKTAGEDYAVSPKDTFVKPAAGDLKLIKQKLELAGITPQQYADALLKSTPHDFAGEVGGDPLRMQTQAQAKITGPAMQEARDAMRERLAQAPQRTQQIIENAFFPSSATAPTVGADPALAASPLPKMLPVEQAHQNMVDIKNSLPDLYDAANNSTINPTVGRRSSLGVINTPAGQKAMKATVESLSNQGIDPAKAGIVIDQENGFHGLSPQVPVSTLGELQKNLGDQVVRNPMTGAIEDHASTVIEGMRKHITNYLSENSPQFNAANTNAAANFQGTNAFEMGRKLAHSAAGENADAIMQRATDSFSPQELSYFKTGYAQGLSDSAVGAPIGGGSPASRIAKGTVTQTASDIIGPTEAQKFANALMQEKNRVELAQRGLYGSNTAETLSSGVPEIPTSVHGALAGGLNKVKDFLQAGKNERLAQLLYATSPEQKAILAQRILGQ